MAIVIKDGSAMLDEFYKDWSLTVEGLSATPESLGAYMKILTSLTDVKDGFAFYTVSGKTMNDKYGLTGDNAYPDNLTIVMVMLKDLVNPMKVAVPRFTWGGRWFTDIVDNNARKQRYIDGTDNEDENDD